MAEGKPFDVSRAMLEDYIDSRKYPARLEVSDAAPLQRALEAGHLTPDTRLLTFEADGMLYAVPLEIVMVHNVIQGEIPGKPAWIMTFCLACNTGMVFDPVVDGQTLHFRRRGGYEGMLLIYDDETGTYWQHITGKALHGASAGKALRQIASTRQMNSAEIHTRPDVLFFTAALTSDQERLSGIADKMRAEPNLNETTILSTIAEEDKRRPRFELGLGMWDDHTSAFLPLTTVHVHDHVVRTKLGNRAVIVYQQPEALSPVAVYLESETAVWEGDRLRLDKGGYIQDDIYHTPDGIQPIERPNQLLMRWFGFALTFPDCDVCIA